MIDWCESPDAVLAIFQEQSMAFDEFRNSDPKLVKWLAPLVSGLHAISTNVVISSGASLVSPLMLYPMLYPINKCGPTSYI